MFGFGKRAAHKEIGPLELQAMLAGGSACIVDVREPREFAGGHIPGAINLPLSRFKPATLPIAEGRTVILTCARGMRSAQALRKCADTGVDTHLAGGMAAWIRSGLPVEQ